MPSNNGNGDSEAERSKIQKELADQNAPIYVTFLNLFLKTVFAIYDVVMELPFKMFADPAEKLELSGRVKAQPTKENDPSSDWRHVDTIDGDLLSNAFECETLGHLWDKSVKNFGSNASMGTRELLEFEQTKKDGRTLQHLHFGEYQFQTYEEVDEIVTSVAHGLRSYGLRKDDRVVIFAETRAEWMQTAFACFKSGLPVATVYATLGDDAVAFAVKEIEPKIIFTSRSLISKVVKAMEQCASVEAVVYYKETHHKDDDSGYATSEQTSEFKKLNKKLESFDTLVEIGSGASNKLDKPKADDLAVIMYTSGSTGNPKGVMLSHRNILAAIGAQEKVFCISPDDVFIGYLPLAHIFELCAELILLSRGARIGYSSAQTLFDRAPKIKKGTLGDCAALKPTLMTCVPAVMDRIFKAVTDEVKSKSVLFREAFRIFYERKRARYEEGYTSPVMNNVVFNKIRGMLGGNLTRLLSGGAPLNPETQRFVNICFCCPVLQGYGLTETCAGGTVMDPHDLSTGSVGPPLRSCEIRLREWSEAGYSPTGEKPQGEILIAGDMVALGYYKNEEKTKEEFIEMDGKRYFATGDIGEFRSDGSLRIIDRKKDLVKLAHGEYVSLGKVETQLLTSPIVDNICAFGDSNRDFLIALVVLNQKKAESLAQENGIDGSWEEMCKSDKLKQLVAKELQSFSSGKLGKAETPQKVVLCAEPWTPATGLLTEALKLKRKNIEKEYKDDIKAAYSSK